ncbi:MAG: pilus assembly protein CpaB, partial [Ruminococcus sp.]|nr:pilus assembly protein CpaB [Ruminococcus sp.]
IVSVIAPDYKKTGITEIPLELQFVEVIAATTKTGSDVDEEFNEESELPSTVTLLVSEDQSKMLADLEKTGTIHMSLVYRGDRKTAEEFLKKQKELNEQLKAEAEGTANSEGENAEQTGESEAVGDETQ